MSELAKLRMSKGLTQLKATPLLGLSYFTHLSAIETGGILASEAVRERMTVVYGVSREKVDKAARQTFENGRTMKRHREKSA